MTRAATAPATGGERTGGQDRHARPVLVKHGIPWLALILALVAGCGNSRTSAPSLSAPAQPAGFHLLGYRSVGLSFKAPRNWTVFRERAPLVTVVASGAATVAIWRYPRSAAVPAGRAALQRARNALIAAARARDPRLQVIRSKLTRLDHSRAIELDAIEQIAGQTRRVRSTHVFVRGAELVLDEYAPLASFHAVDHSVFSPIRRSLRVRSPKPA